MTELMLIIHITSGSICLGAGLFALVTRKGQRFLKGQRSYEGQEVCKEPNILSFQNPSKSDITNSFFACLSPKIFQL